MLVGLSNLTNYDDTLKYSLNPLERVLCPFKKHRFNDFSRKWLNENGIIETLEGNDANYNAISSRYSSNTKDKH